MTGPMSRRAVAFLMMAAAGGCAGADGSAAEGEPVAEKVSAVMQAPTVIKIGALDDPGTTPKYGDAIRLAVSQMNEGLAAMHSKVQFAVAFGDDRGNNPAVARAETLRLLNDEHVVAMVSDSSGDTIQVNRLNYDPASPAPYKVPVVCYQCSNGFINDPSATDADPISQAALRDSDNWLRRIFYNANFEAKVIDQIILSKPNLGDRNGDGKLKLSIYADGGHVSLANALGPTLALYTSQPTSIEIVLLSSPANMPAQWAQVVDGFNQSTQQADGEPDYVVMAMLPVNVTAAVQSYRAGGYTLPVISNNSFRRNYILPLVGPGANGLEGSSVALANSNLSGQLFIDAFTAAYGSGPEQTSSGAYDSVTTLMLAALVASNNVHHPSAVTPAGIRAALDTINNPQGVKVRPSALSFAIASVLVTAGLPMNYDGAYDGDDWNAAGDIFPPLVHWTVENNTFVEHESYLVRPGQSALPAAVALRRISQSETRQEKALPAQAGGAFAHSAPARRSAGVVARVVPPTRSAHVCDARLHVALSRIATAGAPMFMARILMALVLAAPLATGCVVRSHGHGPPAHASGGWRGGPPPGHVPSGQVRRAEVHQRNEARKADKNGPGRGHHGRGRGHGR